MQRVELEPGLLRIFRIYAWLRLAFLLSTTLIIPILIIRSIPFVDWEVPTLLILVDIFLLLGYLYWAWLQDKLGRFYLPLAVVIATAMLLLEQFFFEGYRGLWQLFPFLYILLIIVAWQYPYRNVVLFALGTALFDGLLNVLFPRDLIIYLPFPNSEYMVVYGLLLSRTISFLVVGYVVSGLMHAQRAQRQSLADANLKLVQHAATLEQLATSRERNRLSRELHDTLAHTLSALTVQLEALTTVWDSIPAKPKVMLEQMLATTRSGLDETRRALSALRASPLEEMGLALAVRNLVRDFAERNALALEMDIPAEFDDLSPEVEQCFYRVTQEALENIGQHAGAEKVSVHMRQHGSLLGLEIHDDGQGFNMRESRQEDRLGIKGMQERAELIDARLTIDSQLEGGTEVRLEWGAKP
jgi:signal transduction histidine kinase